MRAARRKVLQLLVRPERFGKGPHGGTADSPQTPVCSRSQLRWPKPAAFPTFCLPTKQQPQRCAPFGFERSRFPRSHQQRRRSSLWSFLLSNLPPFPRPQHLAQAVSGSRSTNPRRSRGDVCSPGFFQDLTTRASPSRPRTLGLSLTVADRDDPQRPLPSIGRTVSSGLSWGRFVTVDALLLWIVPPKTDWSCPDTDSGSSATNSST